QSLGLINKPKTTIPSHIDMLLDAFDQITSLINSITDPIELLENILDVAIRFVNADRGLIALIDKDNETLRIEAIRNLDEKTSKDVAQISQTVLYKTSASDMAIMSGDAPSDSRFSTIKSVREYNILSLICMPLRIKGKSMGVIYVDSRRTSNLFSERDKQFLQAFSNLAAVAIERSYKYKEQEEEKELLKEEIQGRYRFNNLLGKSKIMQEVFQRLESISRTDTSVLVTGSSGTGKELAARAIHYNSHRKNGRFVAVNCAAIPEHLVESELFGFTKGAFTDARQDKIGRFEHANAGTLFLDEVAEMPINVQAKLLRAIEQKEIQRLGEDDTRKIDVRIIAATNRDLRIEIQEKRFREDFYYRLRVASIRMPDLSERMDDLPLLAKSFLNLSSNRNKRYFTEFDSKALEALLHYSWPGNIRELENAIESAVVFGNPPVIHLKDLPQEIRVPFAKSGGIYDKPELQSLDEIEEAHIRAILTSTNGNKLKTCNILNISRPTLDRKLEKFNITIKKMRQK
ncbi:sigma-54-dependent Fis family transcriptional regulator, partial [bacterium]|nr:sigma-54-dependent Fis family transcriptional regulator [candidate division CSSED10-310 bacterium]